jgi:serine/threonine-protein kinase RsbT
VLRSETRVPIASEVDVVVARQQGRKLAESLGFTSSEQTLIATAISEMARNIVQYVGQGEIRLSVLEEGAMRGLGIVAHDEGPGIPDIEQAMQDGYSTSGGLGLGLPGAKRLMDEFDVVSRAGAGTTITMKKWTR